MENRTNTEVVQGIYEAVSSGDVPAVLDRLTNDVEWTLQGPAAIPFAGTRHGHKGVAEFFALVGQTLEFHQFEPREIVAQGDLVVVVGYERSAFKSTGRLFEQEWTHVYTLKNGKVAKVQAFEDTAGLIAGLAAD